MQGDELTDFEWGVIAPLLPNKPRGVPRVDDRRLPNGIFWVLRTGAPWRALPKEFGPPTTSYNRFVPLAQSRGLGPRHGCRQSSLRRQCADDRQHFGARPSACR